MAIVFAPQPANKNMLLWVVCPIVFIILVGITLGVFWPQFQQALTAMPLPSAPNESTVSINIPFLDSSQISNLEPFDQVNISQAPVGKSDPFSNK